MKLFSKLLMLSLVGLAASACSKQTAGGPGGPGGIPPTQVVAAEARRQPISDNLSLVGTLAANEMVEIKSEIDGTVAEINFKEGDRVEAGRLLIKLDESKMAVAVAEAEANFNLGQANYDRARQLSKSGLATPQELDRAAAQFQVVQAALNLRKRLLKDARILAPFAGVVGTRSVSPGQVIDKQSTLTWLVDLDPVKAEVNVPERFLSQLRVGQNIDMTVAAYPSKRFAGQVFFIAPSVDPVTRTALVKASVANPNLELKPGMFANLELTVKLKEQAIVIPESAVMLNGDRTTVYVLGVDDAVQIRPVKLGVRLAGVVEVVEGLQDGERVVAEGTQKVFPGSKVRTMTATGSSSEPRAAQSKVKP